MQLIEYEQLKSYGKYKASFERIENRVNNRLNNGKKMHHIMSIVGWSLFTILASQPYFGTFIEKVTITHLGDISQQLHLYKDRLLQVMGVLQPGKLNVVEDVFSLLSKEDIRGVMSLGAQALSTPYPLYKWYSDAEGYCKPLDYQCISRCVVQDKSIFEIDVSNHA